MIIDGRALAGEILARTQARISHAGLKAPKILAIVANETPATKSYLSIKARRASDAGCVLEIKQFSETASAKELQSVILASDADAIIVQLPLPAGRQGFPGIDAKSVCDSIPLSKDADILSDVARQKFARGDTDASVPPVVGAIREIFVRNAIDPKGKKTAVIGRGFLVGAPAALWLAQQGARVTAINRSTKDFIEVLREADIIISGAGSPHFITPDMLKKAKTAKGGSPDGSQSKPFRGVVLIDAGTSESSGEVVGDADPACADKCSLFTPVPGGIGPLAVACLFENVVTLMKRNS